MTVPERLSFSAQLTKCNVGPCCHGMAHIGACWHSAFSTFHSLGQLLQGFYQVLSCQNSPRASLGRILVRNHRKTLMSTKACFCGKAFPRQTCNNHLRRKQGCKLTVDFTTIFWRQPWEELVPWERTSWHWSKHVKFRPSWQFHTGCLSLHGWQTAMLADVGTLNSARSAFSTFHTTFIRAKASVVLSSSFVWK